MKKHPVWMGFRASRELELKLKSRAQANGITISEYIRNACEVVTGSGSLALSRAYLHKNETMNNLTKVLGECLTIERALVDAIDRRAQLDREIWNLHSSQLNGPARLGVTPAGDIEYLATGKEPVTE